MTFLADVSTPEGLVELNNYLQNNSYISGYQPSKADQSVFEALGGAPKPSSVNVLRWYNHIASFNAAEKASWGGQACPLKAGAKPTTAKKEDDDDLDLFGSDDDEENAEAAAVREKRLQEYADKKSKKPVLIAKSSIVLDVKPWDDETDMKKMEEQVRTIEMDGLVWGASKLVPVGYGIHKLQIMCVVEDDKVSIDLLQERIQEFEDFVQSVDIAAFNKI